MTIKHFFGRFLRLVLLLSITVIFCAILASVYFLDKLHSELPDIKQLRTVEYQVPLSVYSRDNILLAQFGDKKRVPITFDQAPEPLIHAFLAAEDGNFYSHPGVDFKGLTRAAIQLILTGKKKQGGSTITMQVTRNFLLSREKTYIRKIKEIILALKIEKEFSKEEILELYLNKIYLGHHSYGVAAAASIYYGKKLPELNLAQLAMLAGLPKAPSTFNPVTNPTRALQRRNYVLRRMLKLTYITQEEFDQTIEAPVSASLHFNKRATLAPYISEMVRQEMLNNFGSKAYTLGLKVHTTIDSKLQSIAGNGVKSALHQYDYRHGYRSLPHKNQPTFSPSDYISVGDVQSAHVTSVSEEDAGATLKDGTAITLLFEDMKWAKPYKSLNHKGPALKSPADLLKKDDLIQVRQRDDATWELSQTPSTQAAFVAINAQNGAILSLTGGFDFFNNKYNRATQSKRQPGSGFKPIIYTTALENGFTPASLINDTPVIADSSSEEQWRPENYSKKFFGPTPLRTGLRKSRNLISIRLLRDLGIEKVSNTALRFGFAPEQIPQSLTLALGSGHATPLQMAKMYATFENGGFLVEPYFIDRVENYQGEVLFQATPKTACRSCDEEQLKQPTIAPRIISPQICYLMNTLLRDVVQRGTATRAKVLKRTDLAGKTGTTNEQRDTWFNGFSSGIAATAWLGFDTSKPLGRREAGGVTALPIWIDFMRAALADRPEKPLIMPKGIVKKYITPSTGLLARKGSRGGIWEYFLAENAPKRYASSRTRLDDQEYEESLF